MPISDATIDNLGFIFSKDDEKKSREITFSEFLSNIAPRKPEDEMISEAALIERFLTYYEKFEVKITYNLTFKQFLLRARDGTWQKRFTA